MQKLQNNRLHHAPYAARASEVFYFFQAFRYCGLKSCFGTEGKFFFSGNSVCRFKSKPVKIDQGIGLSFYNLKSKIPVGVENLRDYAFRNGKGIKVRMEIFSASSSYPAGLCLVETFLIYAVNFSEPVKVTIKYFESVIAKAGINPVSSYFSDSVNRGQVLFNSDTGSGADLLASACPYYIGRSRFGVLFPFTGYAVPHAFIKEQASACNLNVRKRLFTRIGNRR